MQVRVLTQVFHNGTRYGAGAVLSLNDKQAQEIMDCKAAQAASVPEKPEALEDGDKQPAEKSLSRMNHGELEAVALEEGLSHSADMTRKQLSEAIRVKREGTAPEQQDEDSEEKGDGFEPQNSGDESQPDEQSDNQEENTGVKAGAFELGGDKYAKDGNSYTKNGEPVSRLDYLNAKKQAEES